MILLYSQLGVGAVEKAWSSGGKGLPNRQCQFLGGSGESALCL